MARRAPSPAGDEQSSVTVLVDMKSNKSAIICSPGHTWWSSVSRYDSVFVTEMDMLYHNLTLNGSVNMCNMFLHANYLICNLWIRYIHPSTPQVLAMDTFLQVLFGKRMESFRKTLLTSLSNVLKPLRFATVYMTFIWRFLQTSTPYLKYAIRVSLGFILIFVTLSANVCGTLSAGFW